MRPSRLDVSQLTCRAGRHTLLQDVNLTLVPGEHVALLGANGAGKTSLLRAILGLLPATSGEIRLDGRLQPRPCPATWPKAMAWIPQRPPRGQVPFRVKDLLAAPSAWAWAQRLGIAPLATRPLTHLSGGELQRVFIARALGQVAAGTGLVLADEPTAALDFEGQDEIGAILTALPVTMLLITHDPAQAARCHRALTMAHGKLRPYASAL